MSMTVEMTERRTPPPPPEWGLHFKRLLGRAGLTGKQLAEQVGVTEGTVHHWRTGVRYPATAYLPAIRDALGLGTIDELIEPQSRIGSDLDAIRRDQAENRRLLEQLLDQRGSRRDPNEWP